MESWLKEIQDFQKAQENNINDFVRTPIENREIIKSIIQNSINLSYNSDDFLKSFSKDLQSKFPNAVWRTINGSKVLINGNKVVAGLDGFNGMIDQFFDNKSQSGSQNNKTPLRQSINKLENKIISKNKNKYESLGFLDKNGKEIAFIDGDKGSVKIPPEIGDKIVGLAVATHNHPSSRSFSYNDIFLTLNKNIGEMRAIAPNSIEGEGIWVFKNSMPPIPSWLIDKIAKQTKESDGVIRDKMHDFINNKNSKYSEDEKYDIANTLHQMAALMSTPYYKGIKSKGKVEMYFEKKDGTKIDMVDIMKKVNIDL